MRMAGVAAGGKRLRLLVRIAPETPFRLIGDPHHLRAVLLIWLSNAIKFTHAGYVTLEVEPVVVGPDNVRLRFAVRDTGIGIAAATLENIRGRTPDQEGDAAGHVGSAGLGTTIARRLVELMGGRIAVTSDQGWGSTCGCELPFRRQPGETIVNTLHARILMLSTDPQLQEQYRECSEVLGSTLVAVSSAAEAGATLARGIRLGNPWDLVLVDDREAVRDGQHLAAELVDKALAANLPVYLVTDAAREAEQLRRWGYASQLPRHPWPMLLAGAIHASPHHDVNEEPAAGVLRVEPWAWGSTSRARRRVLIADDNQTNLLITRHMLEAGGYEVDAVADGQLALERIAGGGYKAAIIDFHMPGFDGVDLLRRYRLLQPGVRVPIIMLTADATFGAQSDSAEAGADAFLTKPVSVEVMLSTLDRLIHEREVRSLPVAPRREDRSPNDEAVLDVSVLAEVDRVCKDPVRLAAVVASFESEGDKFLERLAAAWSAQDYAAFAEWVHAMKGNAANVGAKELVATCRRIERAGAGEFQRDGAGLVQRLREQFVRACAALRELTVPVSAPGQRRPGPHPDGA
jgi:two-component system sensor histidine kinase RpfC